MEETQISEQAPEKTSFKAILDRIAEPFAVFSVALLVLLVIAQLAVLPLFNKFEVNGRTLKPGQLAQYRAELVRQVDEAEATRDNFVMPVKNETYRILQEQKDLQPVLAPVKEAVEAAARETQGEGSIAFARFHLEGHTVSVRGDVLAGVSSMTVLAAFIERVESLPFVDTFVRPAFTREEDPVLGAHSPFTFSFTLGK